jgi:Fic family protein
VTIRAYVPAPIGDLDLRVGGTTVAAVSDAESQIAAAQEHADRAGVSTIAAQLLRSEAIASSQIEGIDTPSQRSLAKALFAAEHGSPIRLSASAAATIANVRAVRDAYRDAASTTEPFSIDDLVQTHVALAQADRHLAAVAGRIRDRQNWIGRDPLTPANADFVPPPARLVADLLDDLCAFMRRTDLPPLVQAAVAHAQFETIHPFADGNGRVGRALIGIAICRGGLARDVLPPTSLVLARERREYIDGLTAWRFEPDGPDRWVTLLARAAERAALATIALADDIAALQARWREMSSHRRSDSAAAAIVDALPAHPILNAADAAALTGRSEQRARAALNQLEADGVLAQVTLGRRNRAWESVGLFALVDRMEHELSGGAIAAGGTA